MVGIIDTNRNCARHITCLKRAGVHTVLRYYSRTTRQSEKRLTPTEFFLLSSNFFNVAVVYQDYGRGPGDFSQELAERNAAYCLDYAQNTIHQPLGSTIYFAVDYDASQADLQNAIVPYFRAVDAQFAQMGDSIDRYHLGVYGSGLVCQTMLDAGLAQHAWLSQSTGFRGYDEFYRSGAWSLTQKLPITLCSISIDPNEPNPARPDFGAFRHDGPPLPITSADWGGFALPEPQSYVVKSREGLRLRAGPATTFDVVEVMPYGLVVTVVGRVGEWCIIDTRGDGIIDGCAHSAFLMSVY